MGQAPPAAAVIQQQQQQQQQQQPLLVGQVIATTTTTITGQGPGPGTMGRAPCISEIGRKGSVDSSSGILASNLVGGLTISSGGLSQSGTLRRLHSYPSSSDTDTSPPIARLQVSLQEQPGLTQALLPGQKPPVPERNAELLQLASARRVPPPPPPRTSSRSPLASPTSPQLPPRNHQSSSSSSSSSSCTVAQQLSTGIGNASIPVMTSSTGTLRRPLSRGKEGGGTIGKPPMALPSSEVDGTPISSTVLSTSNSSSCESVNSQEGLQSKRGRQEQLEQRHQELLRKQKALQEQYARLQQLQRNAAGLATVPPAPPDLLKKTGSESNLLAKMGLGMSAASSGSLTSLSVKTATLGRDAGNAVAGTALNIDLCNSRTRFEGSSSLEPSLVLAISNADNDHHAKMINLVTTIDNNIATTSTTSNASNTNTTTTTTNTTTTTITTTTTTTTTTTIATTNTNTNTNATTTTTSKIYETDIL